MIKKIAYAISVLLHPLLMPTFGILIIFSITSQLQLIAIEHFQPILLIVVLSSFILPLSSIPIFLHTKLIKSIQMETARERIIPLFVTAIFYFIGFLFLVKFFIPRFVALFYLGSLIAVMSAMLISYFWKVSIHMVGIGGLIGALIAMAVKHGIHSHIWIFATILLAGVLASSRLILGSHTPKQIYAGFLLGAIEVYFLSTI